MKQVIFTERAPKAIGPYSQAIQAQGLLFVSGQLPVNPADGSMPVDIKAQTRQSLENVKAIVEEAGFTLVDVVKTTVFVKDMNQFAEINEVYATYFTEQAPARACIEVARLPKDAGVEIEAVVSK